MTPNDRQPILARVKRRVVTRVTDLLRAVGADAVAIQEGWDRAHEHEMRRFEHSVAALESVLGDAARDLAPSRLRLSRHEIDLRLRLSTERSAAGALGVRLLNRSHDLLYARTTETTRRDSRMKITITQVPVWEGKG